jgi:hypothetical protein
MNKVTAFFTSCGRWNLLENTLRSFHHYNTYPIERYIVIDNSTLDTAPANKVLSDLQVPYVIISNAENIGQVASIDKGYKEIQTDLIFHCEDDWLCLGGGFIEKSIDLLEFDEKIVNINVRVRFDEEASSQHPIGPLLQTNNGTEYHEYIPRYHGIWHGFAWNPGLRRKKEYDLIKPFKQWVNEQGVGGKYYELGYKSACLKDCYFAHIGKGQHTFKRNE